MKRITSEFMIVACLGVAVAVVANSVRATGSLRWNKNYFARVALPIDVAKKTDAVEKEAPQVDESAPPHIDHGYNDISVADVRLLFDDPGTAAGVNVFVDARNDQSFNEGHIPGAIQFDHYQPEGFIDAVLEAASTADAVVVYCNGGECEDSILVCGDLMELGIPYDTIHLFAGGWQAWTTGGHPVETGGMEE